MRENDENRWEAEVQRYKEEQEMKEKIIDGTLFSIAATMFFVILVAAMAL